MSELTKSQSYKDLLTDIKARIRTAQVKAMITVNQELLALYWDIGKNILDRQNQAGWGSKVVIHLVADLKKEFPNMKGFSKTNLKYMQQFATMYPDFELGQAALGLISWYHNITLMQKCSNNNERKWYAAKAVEHGWSRNVMVHHIEHNLYQREGKITSNFKNTLPSPQSDLAQQSFKDPYIFDFLTLTEDGKEKELEDALIKHMTKFLLELGVGFAYVGRQYRVAVAGEDFMIDLLFYHIKLRCYVAIELKVGKFKPAYIGQMNFYLSALDDMVRETQDNPTIGIILCKDKNNVTAEYALRDISKPIGIAEYKLTDAIPQNLKSNLPSIEDLEKELEDVEPED